jgi:hypothetical protein
MGDVKDEDDQDDEAPRKSRRRISDRMFKSVLDQLKPRFARIPELVLIKGRDILEAANARASATTLNDRGSHMVIEVELGRALLLQCYPGTSPADIDGARRRLEAMPNAPPKRVLYTLAALRQCAPPENEPLDVHAISVVLAMTRNTVDKNKERALKSMVEGTCFQELRPDCRDLFLFVPELPQDLLLAARDLFDVLSAERAAALRVVGKHEEAKDLRRIWRVCNEAAKQAWVDFPRSLDAKGVRPLDLKLNLEKLYTACGLSASEVKLGVDEMWRELRLDAVLPSNLSAETTWSDLRPRIERPPLGVIRGAWRRRVGARFPEANAALDVLEAAVKKADEARKEWNEAQDATLWEAKACPPAVREAIRTFNEVLDEALARSAKEEGSR